MHGVMNRDWIMELPNFCTCNNCGQRTRIKWELKEVEFAAGRSECFNCRIRWKHFVGDELTIKKIARLAEQQSELILSSSISMNAFTIGLKAIARGY